MLFNSLTFILYLALFIFLYSFLTDWRFKKMALLSVSFFFYSFGRPWSFFFIALSTFVDWFASQKIERCEHVMRRRLYLFLALGLNLSLLIYFKYLPYGSHWAVPIGISFYTFQSMSYTLDVYFGRIKAQASFLDFSLFVAFFPQLVSGPITRAADFLPQCEQNKKLEIANLKKGLGLFVLGLLQKIVLADRLFYPVVEVIFNPQFSPSFWQVWAGAFAFSGQLFFDFCGYSMCAVGLAAIFGFTLPDNFRTPYASASFTEFWNRWHITLSKWFRDYVFFPLTIQGRSLGRAAVALSLLLTMGLSGLWHGSGTKYLLWGLFHGGLLILEYFFLSHLQKKLFLRKLLMPLTFIFISFSYLIFRASDESHALELMKRAVGGQGLGGALIPSGLDPILFTSAMLGVIVLLFFQIKLKDKSSAKFWMETPAILKWLALAVTIAFCLFWPDRDRQFIYLQF